FHRLLDGPLHTTAETLAFFQLIRDILGHQLSIYFGPGHFHGFDLDMTVGDVLELLRELIDFLPLLADDDSNTGGINENDDLFASPLDANAGNPSSPLLHALVDVLLDVLADIEILDQQIGEFLLARIPGALPIEHDAGAKADWTNFLTHEPLSSK